MKSPKKAAEQKSGKSSEDSNDESIRDSNVEAADDAALDAVALIKNDHRKVEALFEQFESAETAKQAEIAKQVCTELIVHAMIEEELLYPACRQAGVEDDMLDEAQVEHDGAKILILEVIRETPDDEFYSAKVKVLSEYIKHHVAEEEEPEKGILAKAQKAGVDMHALGQKLRAKKLELMQQAERGKLDLPVPKSLHTHPQQQMETSQEDRRMDRYGTQERDERGRFVSEDDDDRRSRDQRGRFESDDNRGRYSRGRDDDDRRRSSRSRDDDYDDDHRSSGQGQGWYGDSEGHREAAMRGRGDDRQSYRSRGRDNDDYEDRQRSRSRDDDDYPSSGGGRGWSGDSEGHAEAARRGWENRGSSRSSNRSDEDYDDDRRGGSRGSRSRGEEGHGGWFGDSRGDAEAARRGWDERSSGSRTSGSRSRRDDDDDRRGSRSRDEEGHGGWFGDSRGHAEAARRGWQNRDR